MYLEDNILRIEFDYLPPEEPFSGDASNPHQKVLIVKINKLDVTAVEFENDYWYISYDNGTTWTKLEKAVGEDGVAVDGIFESVEQDEQFVYLKLKGGDRFVFQKYGKAAELVSLKFIARQNPTVLIQDAVCEIVDNVCEVMIPHIVPNKNLIPVFDFIGESVMVGDVEITSGETQLDFSKPVTFNVVSSRNDITSYTVNVRAFTGLPVITINTNDGKDVVSKDSYKDAPGLSSTISIISTILHLSAVQIFTRVSVVTD